jgi:hypothetical protein
MLTYGTSFLQLPVRMIGAKQTFSTVDELLDFSHRPDYSPESDCQKSGSESFWLLCGFFVLHQYLHG